jgi:hypothetical protein
MSLGHRDLPRRLKAGITAMGLLCSTILVWQSTSAVFTGTTSNPTNSWSAGTVALVDDDGGNSPTTGTAMFSTAVSTANLMPGNTGTHCIRVTYNGSFTSPPAVKVYATGLSGTGLGTYLDLTIEEDTNGQGTYSSCGTFAGTYIYQSGTPGGSTGTLGYFAANMTGYATGVGTWTPTAAGQAKTYRFRYTVQNDDLAQGLAAALNFVWEAHSA